MSNPADQLIETLKDTFVRPVTNILDTIDKYTPSILKPKESKVDTSWHDQMVKDATKSFTSNDSAKSARQSKTVEKHGSDVKP